MNAHMSASSLSFDLDLPYDAEHNQDVSRRLYAFATTIEKSFRKLTPVIVRRMIAKKFSNKMDAQRRRREYGNVQRLASRRAAVSVHLL